MIGLAFRAWGHDNQELVDRLKENEILRSESVERAFRLTDRALFVPCTPAPRRGQEEGEDEEAEAELPEGGGSPNAAAARAPRLGVARATADQLRQAKEHAYMDSPVKIGNVHISAPHMYALILEKLALKPGMSFLNLGSGSGYLSCMASVLVGASGLSHGVELKADVVEHARRCSTTWRRRMRRWRKAQRQEAAAVATAASLQPFSEGDAAAAAASSAGVSRKRKDRDATASDNEEEAKGMESGDSEGEIPASDEEEAEDAAMADAAAAGADDAASAGAGPAPARGDRPVFGNLSAMVQLPGVGGRAPQRGVIGPAGDYPREGAGAGADQSGDADATRALRRSVMPLGDFLNMMMPRARDMAEREAAQEAAAAASAAASGTEASPAAAAAAPTADASRPASSRSPAPSPSPSPSMASSGGESASSEVGGAGASWRPGPELPVPLPATPTFLAGDAFDLDRSPSALKYDRVYIGAALPERYISTFAELLHPGGRLVAPFDSSMRLVTKLHDGSIKQEHITSVGYAELVLPRSPAGAGAEAAAPRPRLAFSAPAFRGPEDLPFLPAAMRAAMNAILILQARDGAMSPPGRLPLPLWTHILSFASREWWMDRARGAVPWAVSPQDLLAQARAKLAEGEADATGHKWAEADASLLQCIKLLEHCKEEAAVVTETAESILGEDVSSSSIGPSSSINAQIESTQLMCWRRMLPVLMHLERFGRAARVASSILALRPRDTAVLFVRARALFKEDELTDAILVATQLLELLQKDEKKTAESAAGASSTAETAVGTPTSASASAGVAGLASASSTPPSSAPPSPALSAAAATSSAHPLDLVVPSRAQADELLSQLNAAMPAYRSRQRGLRHTLFAFVAQAMRNAPEGEGEEEGEEP